MNTTHNARFSALAFALVMTMAMLLGVDTLATLDPAVPQMAQASSAPRG